MRKLGERGNALLLHISGQHREAVSVWLLAVPRNALLSFGALETTAPWLAPWKPQGAYLAGPWGRARNNLTASTKAAYFRSQCVCVYSSCEQVCIHLYSFFTNLQNHAEK